MGLFGKKKNSGPEQNMEQGGVFMMHLLMEEKCGLPDKELICSAMNKYIPDTECIGYSDSFISFAAKKYTAHFSDKDASPMLSIFGCNEIKEQRLDTIALSQMWDCPDADEILEKCRYQVTAVDMLGAAMDYKDRADMLMDFLQALMESYPSCRAVLFETSKKMLTRERIMANASAQEERFIANAVNVRFFNIEGTDDMLVDTVGMSTLFLPDLQYHFHGLDPNDIVRHAYTMVSYIYSANCPIKNGDTIDGLKDGMLSMDIQWKCRYENSLVAPVREVIDICPGEFASGVRD